MGTDSTITNMEIRGFDGVGIRLQGDGNRVEANSISGNTGAGISVTSGAGNRITHNSIHDNGGLGIELGSGVTAIHKGPPDEAYPNNAQNYPVLFNAIAGESTSVSGALHGAPSTDYSLEFYSNDACDSSNYGKGQVHLGDLSVTTNSDGDAAITASELPAVAGAGFISATATDPNGNTSGFSPCITVGPDNTSWQQPTPLTPTGSGDLLEASAQQYLDVPGQSRWYRIQCRRRAR